MIIVRLIGGLGNQMFQYAAAKSLALKHNVPVKVDLSFLEKNADGYTQRHYELDGFKDQVQIATDAEIKIFSRSNTRLTRVVQRIFPFLFKSLTANESGSQYHQQFKHYPKNTYLNGFWQSELYFNDHAPEIRSAFELKEKLPAELNTLSEKIKNTNSVSVHVRRGDYVNLKSASDFHGNCGVEYYQEAVDFISKQKNDIELFIFSDDIAWCKEHLTFNQPVNFITHNFAAIFDLYLMSQCRHNIIANSSFSWWGAWLNHSAGKLVIMPEFWFVGKKSSSLDIVAKGWITL